MQIICHGLKDEDFQVEFTDHRISLGRDASNGIVVTADAVSRYHAFLIEEGNDLFLQDNNSLNGTFLNYNQIHDKQKLASGDILQIGYRLIKVDFFPPDSDEAEQKVVLDFVPPEETEIVSPGTDILPASPAQEQLQEQEFFSGNDIDRTILAPETLSSSNVSENSLFSGGSEIGKYVVIRQIGKGGMGEVYLAKHKTLGIFRALKVLPKSADDKADQYDRFIREAKLASEIRHPNVVGVMDVETDSATGFSYIIMEYVDGGSLRNSLTASKRLSEEQAVVIVEAVASALQAAEEHDIVHRDIKPDNIMFTKRGEVKLADLGIAKISGKENDLTKTNMMIGTPAYLPPEQAQNAKGVDCRADIYSLGATYYEMLTGEPPYPGENTIEVLHKLFLTPVPDPRKINPDISPASAAIIMKMLAKDPKDRFQNAGELLEKMERTFPLHSAGESAELIQKVIAGECLNRANFTSSISSSILSLWWLKLSGAKKLYLAAALLAFACCLVGVLLLFGKRHAARSDNNGPLIPVFVSDNDIGTSINTNPVEQMNQGRETIPDPVEIPEQSSFEILYALKINTTPDSEIYLTCPDGQTILRSSGQTGQLILPELKTGQYKVRILRDKYLTTTSDFELDDDMTLDLPLEAVAAAASSTAGSSDKTGTGSDQTAPRQAGKTYELQIQTAPDSEIGIVYPDGQEKHFASVYRGLLNLTGLPQGEYKVTILNDHYKDSGLTRNIMLSNNMRLDMPLKPGPLVVSSGGYGNPDLETIYSSRDGETSSVERSLLKAISNAPKGGKSSIVFDKDYTIVLGNRLPLGGSNRNITIDGGSNKISLYFDRYPMIDIPPQGVLRLKNLSIVQDFRRTPESFGIKLNSDRGGALELISVTSDEKTEWQLMLSERRDSYFSIILGGSTHLYNFRNMISSRPSGSGGAIRIENQAILEKAEIPGLECSVYGFLKNASVVRSKKIKPTGKDVSYNSFDLVINGGAAIEVFDGGKCENLSIENGYVEHHNGGTINGLKISLGCLYGYEPDAVLSGTVVIGGVAMEPNGKQPCDRPIIEKDTDIVFDLESRTEKSKFRAAPLANLERKYPECDYLIQNMNAFLDARSYTIQVGEDQPIGKYRLADNAAKFNAPVSLKIGNKVYPDALSVRKSFSANGFLYTLSQGRTELALTIRADR